MSVQYCFGIDVGGTTVKCGLFSTGGDLLDKWEIPTRTQKNGMYILPDVAQSILTKLDEKSIMKDEVAGIGIGVPGPVTNENHVGRAVNLHWGAKNVADEMKEMTGIPTKAGNDANVAALGEQWKGGGRGYSDMLMVTLGTGVGGGLILGGKIVCGSNGAAAEIGHIVVNPAEMDFCGCGCRGHLEQYASATGIVRMAKKRLASEAVSTSLHAFSNLSAKDIFDEAKKGDEVACSLVDTLGSYLALALSHVAAVADPVAFVIGGGVSKAGQILLDAIEKHYNENILPALRGKVFRLAELGNDAGIYGAARMTLENR